MKKTLAIILAALMLLSCVSVASVSAAATKVITLNGKDYDASGAKSVTYTCTLTAPELIENGQFTLYYPNNILKAVDGKAENITNGYVLNYKENVKDKVNFNFSYVNEGNYGYDFTTPKVFFTLTFDVIGEGKGEITLTKELMCNKQDQNIIANSTFTEALNLSLVGDDTPAPTIKPDANGNVGKGVSEKVAEANLKARKSDADPKGSEFSSLKAKSVKVTKSSAKVQWSKVKNAAKYVVYGNKCASKYKKLATVKATSYTQKKLAKATYYKYLVVAVNKSGKVISTSKTIHVATAGGKVGNAKSIKATNAKKFKSLKKGKSLTIKTKVTAQSKKATIKNHRKPAFESSNTKIATVSSKGVVKAKKKGSATIYVYAQNGVSTTVKVTVK